MKKKIGQVLVLTVLLNLFTGCATKLEAPLVSMFYDVGPLYRFPENDDFFLLARPEGHEELLAEILKNLMPFKPRDARQVLERTRAVSLSGQFTSPLTFSAILDGEFPPFFVRRALKKSPDWHQLEKESWQGPEGSIVYTYYKNSIVATSAQERFEIFRDEEKFYTITEAGESETEFNSCTSAYCAQSPILSDGDRLWWEGGSPVLLFYMPHLEKLPLPRGLKAIPPESSALISLEAAPHRDGAYTLNGELRFSGAPQARMWALALRFFLGARLGLSPHEEEREALGQLNLNADDSVLKITNWTMSPQAWGRFLASFR